LASSWAHAELQVSVEQESILPALDEQSWERVTKKRISRTQRLYAPEAFEMKL
jgi:hypothetical protein